MNYTLKLDPREIAFYDTIDIVRLNNFLQFDDDEVVDDVVMDFYMKSNLMPYGVAKARDGDPYAWIAERVEAYMDHLVSTSN